MTKIKTYPVGCKQMAQILSSVFRERDPYDAALLLTGMQAEFSYGVMQEITKYLKPSEIVILRTECCKCDA